MDDSKTFARNKNQQESLLHNVKTFSDDINVQFGLDKCTKVIFDKGKFTQTSDLQTSDLQLDFNTVIKELDHENAYKHLGVNEGNGIQHSKMKVKITKVYYKRIRLVTKSELNAANKIEAINILAVPVVTYSFNIINWQLKDIKKLDKKTINCLLYLPRKIRRTQYLPAYNLG